jgi:sensor histidine kinase YesM
LESAWYLIASLIILMFILVVTILKLLDSNRKRNELLSQVLHLQKQVDAVDLTNVESKLNPHLFKNILNSIQSHAYQTYFALDKLANVLDYILYDSRSKFVTPKEEIEFALNLIEINKIKVSPLFDFKVKLKLDEHDPLYHQKILAPLISIDLIENAFKHADLQSPDSFITITIEFKEGALSLTVSNKISTRDPIQKERSGLGNATLEQRLKLIYPKNFKLEKFIQGDTYVGHLKINLHEYKA